MSTQLTVPKNFGAISTVFSSRTANDELGAGIASSYGVIGYRGKSWSVKYQGKETVMMRPDGDGPRNSIEVVLVKASSAISKIFYKGGYVEGSSSPPDCWSSNGISPDSGAQNKQSTTCASCPMNAWGSRVTEAGKQGKACSDSRRVAIVPAEDLDNEMFGGPMLLRVPAASLKDLKAYGEYLNSLGAPYYGAVTKISFDPKEAYPKFVFSVVRALTDEEAHRVIELQSDKRVSQVLSEMQEINQTNHQEDEPAKPQALAGFKPAAVFKKDAAPEAPKPVPSSPFEKKKAVTNREDAAPKEPPKPRLVEVSSDDEEENGSAGTPSSFDDMLESIL